MTTESNRLLVKLRPSGALRAAESRANLRPLFEGRADATFDLGSTPQWFIAQLPDGAASPWDLAHNRVADQLGLAPSDVIFAEPDLIHSIYQDTNEERTPEGFGATKIECVQNQQDGTRRKATGPNEIWHIGDNYTQLARARESVAFDDPRTRIAHIDTGYYPHHFTTPAHVRGDLERNFVEGDGNPGSAVDPNNERRILDNSGHGTGTLSILAGREFAPFNTVLGGAPDAEIVPLRVADSVVLLRTSALARALSYAIETECAVITMSMGGLPSQAWAEAVDRVYEAGIVYCAAGGNRTRPFPPKVLVYPARYPRVIAVVGRMANGDAYKDLDGALEGSFGPRSVMKKALAAYTPNIPWARFGCDDIVRLNGEGTSSATPQVAAAAALWLEKFKKVLPRDWRRVEAVRKALFDSAQKVGNDDFGNGALRAFDALAIAPDLSLAKSGRSKNSFAFLRLLTGLGIAMVPPREEMFNLELAQRWLINPELQAIVEDPEDVTRLEGKSLERLMEAIIEDEGASLALRRHVASRYRIVTNAPPPQSERTRNVVPSALAACDPPLAPKTPSHRRLRIYAGDPSLSASLATASMNEVTLRVPWDPAYNDGVGEYIKIDDQDATGERYPAVDINAPALLAQDGWAPAEGNAQFHQQMTYAVAMKTISHFEQALGRPVLWRPRKVVGKPYDDREFVRQLTVRPHALHQANAFYSPADVSLEFGYFEASADHPGGHVPGSSVYTCLSHDIIAHETTHAILDGMHRRFNEATNPDVLAFHEAFADIVALMQHFTIPEVLESEVAKTRGDIEAESILGMLAVQFGQAMGSRGALRSAIGRVDNGVWTRLQPDPSELSRTLAPHARGAILVAAVFDAFIGIYKLRIADLLRIYTGGTGVLPTGAIHPDLVRRLSEEARKAAAHVLEMCVRALDYLPPIDVTFFEYLRALITADFELVSDGHPYRVAFVEAFRRRGIYPRTDDASTLRARTLSVDRLRWRGGVDLTRLSTQERQDVESKYGEIIRLLKAYADETLYIKDREELFNRTREHRQKLHAMLKTAFKAVPSFAQQLGLSFGSDFDADDHFEVHALRVSMRLTSEGKYIPQIVVVLTQSKPIESAAGNSARLPPFRGGATLVVDLTTSDIKYIITKSITNGEREKDTADFVRKAVEDPLRSLLFAPDREEPFAALHSLTDDAL